MWIKVAQLEIILPALEKKLVEVMAAKNDEQHELLRRINDGIRTEKVNKYNTLCARVKQLEMYLSAITKLTDDTEFNFIQSLTFLGNGLNLDEAFDFGRMLAVRDFAQIIADIQ